MSLQKFKSLIKECIREVIREEKLLLESDINKPNPKPIKQISNSNPYAKPSIINNNLDPIQQLMLETKNNMTMEDYMDNSDKVNPLPNINESVLINNNSEIIDGVPNYSKLWKAMNK